MFPVYHWLHSSFFIQRHEMLLESTWNTPGCCFLVQAYVQHIAGHLGISAEIYIGADSWEF